MSKPEIRWAKLNHRGAFWFGMKEVPVYWPPHTDPEIGETAARPHCHVAWNRFSRSRLLRYCGYSTIGKALDRKNLMMILAGQGVLMVEVESTRPCRLKAKKENAVAPIFEREFMLKTWEQLRTK